jgi:hypothetical protein
MNLIYFNATSKIALIDFRFTDFLRSHLRAPSASHTVSLNEQQLLQLDAA